MCSVYLRPCLHYWQDLFRSEVGEREVVGFIEGENVTFTSYWVSAKEEVGKI